MAKYVSCEFCGANLDFGERCDCLKKRGHTAANGTPDRKNPTSILSKKISDVKDKEAGLCHLT